MEALKFILGLSLAALVVLTLFISHPTNRNKIAKFILGLSIVALAVWNLPFDHPTHEEKIARIGQPAVEYFSMDWCVVEEAKPIGALNAGMVIVERDTDGELFSALVIPFREIPIGTKVWLAHVNYMHSVANPSDLLVIR